MGSHYEAPTRKAIGNLGHGGHIICNRNGWNQRDTETKRLFLMRLNEVECLLIPYLLCLVM